MREQLSGWSSLKEAVNPCMCGVHACMRVGMPVLCSGMAHFWGAKSSNERAESAMKPLPVVITSVWPTGATGGPQHGMPDPEDNLRP